MVLNNVPNVNLSCTSYFSVKEFAYLMLANQIYKQHTQATNQEVLSQRGANKMLRNNIFRS